MKHILFAGALLFSSIAHAQTFSGSIKQVGSTNTVTIVVKPSSNISGKISGISASLAIPVSASPLNRPVISVDNSANTNISYVIQNTINQTIQGVDHYVYNVLGTGDVSAAVPVVAYDASIDNPIVNVSFNPYPNLNAKVKLVSLPDGGTDPNPNSFFGLSLDGVDRVDEFGLFYSIPSVSSSSNNEIPSGYSGYSFATTLTDVPLPVRFLNFTATKRDNSALLNWTIENENTLTANYQVERSLNGVDFNSIVTIPAKNNGNSSNAYDYTDGNLSSLRSSGVIYYRIKQLDRDGHVIYTEINKIRLDGKSFSVSIYPNPTKSTATLSFDLLDNAAVNVQILDAAGKQVQQLQFQGIKGLNTKRINLAALSAGNYLVKVQAGAELKLLPIVKSN